MSCKRTFWVLPVLAGGAVLNQVRPGDIVLMHDGGADRTQTILALEIILRELSGQGYTFRSLFRHGVEGAGSLE